MNKKEKLVALKALEALKEKRMRAKALEAKALEAKAKGEAKAKAKALEAKALEAKAKGEAKAKAKALEAKALEAKAKGEAKAKAKALEAKAKAKGIPVKEFLLSLEKARKAREKAIASFKPQFIGHVPRAAHKAMDSLGEDIMIWGKKAQALSDKTEWLANFFAVEGAFEARIAEDNSVYVFFLTGDGKDCAKCKTASFPDILLVSKHKDFAGAIHDMYTYGRQGYRQVEKTEKELAKESA